MPVATGVLYCLTRDQQQYNSDLLEAQKLLDLILRQLDSCPCPANGATGYKVEHHYYLYKKDEQLLLMDRPHKRWHADHDVSAVSFAHQALIKRLAAAEHLQITFDTKKNSHMFTVSLSDL